MSVIKILAQAVVLVALSFAVPAVQAQGRDENRGRSAEQGSRGRAVERGRQTDRGGAQAPRQEFRAQAPQQDYRAQAPRQDYRAQAPRQDYRAQAPRQDYRAQAPRQDYRAQAPRQDYRAQAPRQDYRFQARPEYRDQRRESWDRRSYGYPERYYPSYTFRPRLRIGFGVYLGYPVAYPAYDPYAFPPLYGYPSAYTTYGGVSLEIVPSDASVFVDGRYAGVVYDFYDPSRPLSLGAGRHHIDVQAPGYRPLAFDVNIVPGEVLPYRGDLARF
jgi:hypothetical protein